METELNKQIDKFYENYQGASDDRTPEEKAEDISQEEFVASANPVDWREKKDSDWRSFPTLNQFFTFKCVAFTTAKLAMINFWLKTQVFLHFSPNSIYKFRVNQDSGGMVGDDAFNIWKDKGISLEAVCKSNQIQEADSFEVSRFAKEVAKGFILGDKITITNGDFDRVCSTIQTTGKGVMVWFYFTSREWSQLYPKVMDNITLAQGLKHSVTALDCGLINGTEYIKIEDSAHFGGLNVRYISREFFTARNFLAKYPMNFNYEEAEVKPQIIITDTLTRGMMNNAQVKNMQDLLKGLGYFPINIDSTGNYLQVTVQSVYNWQLANGIADSSKGTIFGSKSLDKMKELINS